MAALCSKPFLSSPAVFLPCASPFVSVPSSLLISHPRFLPLHASRSDDLRTNVAPSLDVSVFRFTLGIPGFDDSESPRVIGIAFGAFLLLNHIFTADVLTAAQMRSEFVGFFNAILSISLPPIGRSLNGQISTKLANSMPKSKQIFILGKNLLEAEKEDLAWGSYMLLKNTRAMSVAIWNGELVCARGLWEFPIEVEGNVLEWLEKTLRKTTLFTCETPLYLASKSDKQGWTMVPNGAICLLLQPFQGAHVGTNRDFEAKKDFILVLSSVSNAFSEKDRTWISMLTRKFSKHCIKSSK